MEFKIWILQASPRAKDVYGQIFCILEMKKEVSLIIKKGLLTKVGNGKTTSFEWDNWTDDDCLKNLFPRLYYVSM